MLPTFTVLELKIKPATSPYPPPPLRHISQLTYTTQLVGGILKWVGARGHSVVERNGFSVHRHGLKSWLCPLMSSVTLSKSWDLLSFCFLIDEQG